MKLSLLLSLIFLGSWLVGCQQVKSAGLLGDFRIGERVQIGVMIYNVYEAQYMLKLGDGPDTRVPDNRLLLVHMSAVNGGSAKTNISIPTFTLIDDSGQTYTESDNGNGVPQWLGFSRKVRPAESLTGTVAFDVQPKHYKLRIADETDEHYALVDIPLSFGDGVPPIEGGGVPPSNTPK